MKGPTIVSLFGVVWAVLTTRQPVNFLADRTLTMNFTCEYLQPHLPGAQLAFTLASLLAEVGAGGTLRLLVFADLR